MFSLRVRIPKCYIPHWLALFVAPEDVQKHDGSTGSATQRKNEICINLNYTVRVQCSAISGEIFSFPLSFKKVMPKERNVGFIMITPPPPEFRADQSQNKGATPKKKNVRARAFSE